MEIASNKIVETSIPPLEAIFKGTRAIEIPRLREIIFPIRIRILIFVLFVFRRKKKKERKYACNVYNFPTSSNGTRFYLIPPFANFWIHRGMSEFVSGKPIHKEVGPTLLEVARQIPLPKILPFLFILFYV